MKIATETTPTPTLPRSTRGGGNTAPYPTSAPGTAPAPVRQRRAYGDMIRILGTIAVVTGHVCDMRLKPASRFALDTNWWVLNCIDSAMRWAVPAYVMLSGALLLDPNRTESAQTFYHKRLARIGVPLVFWSIVFMWFSVCVTGWVPTWQEAWLKLLSGKPYTHMHFIFRIAALYAITPMLRLFLRHASEKMVTGTVLIFLCLGMADSVRNAFTRTELSAFINFAPFLGYYLAGYWLRNANLSTGRFYAAVAVFVLSIVALAGGTGLLVRHFGFEWPPSPGLMLYDFLSPVRVVMALSGWLVLTHIFSNPWPASPSGRAAVSWLASITLGLYLVHPLFRDLIFYQGPLLGGRIILTGPPHWMWPNVWLGVPITAAVVYVSALVVAGILMKIPIVRRITG